MSQVVDDLLTRIRHEFGPNWQARYRDDAPLLAQLNMALERVGAILQRRSVPIHQKWENIELEAGQASCPLPEGFLSTVGLFAGSRQIEQVRAEELQKIRQAAPLRYWAVRWPDFEVAAPPSAKTEITLAYWPVLPKLSKSDPTPWGGRLDTVLVRYAAALLKNVDEFDLGQDLALNQEMEELIMRQLVGISPRVKRGKGWLR